jgi:hypothetical protein
MGSIKGISSAIPGFLILDPGFVRKFSAPATNLAVLPRHA